MKTHLPAACLLVLLATGASAKEERGSAVHSVLSNNVHGLFTPSLTVAPQARASTIGWLANRYDVVLLQEDFEYHRMMAAQMPRKTCARGNGVGWDPRRLGAKILLAPFALLIPNFWPPYGAGVSAFVDPDLAVAGDVERGAYGVCNGWFGENGDCWANKGFLRVGVRGPGGAVVDVYNTHLDAGPSQRSVEVRHRQLSLLATSIEKRPRANAVIVAGDFNVAFNRPGDGEVLMEFRRRLGLKDSGAGPELPYWRERDFILYRGGSGASLTVERRGEAQEFVSEERALSDHPALYAVFRLDPIDGGGHEP